MFKWACNSHYQIRLTKQFNCHSWSTPHVNCPLMINSNGSQWLGILHYNFRSFSSSHLTKHQMNLRHLHLTANKIIPNYDTTTMLNIYFGLAQRTSNPIFVMLTSPCLVSLGPLWLGIQPCHNPLLNNLTVLTMNCQTCTQCKRNEAYHLMRGDHLDQC